MRHLFINITTLLFFTCSVYATPNALFETIDVKTFLIQFENKAEVDAKLYFEKDFVLKFQWEPEGLYLITKLSTDKKQLYKITEQLNLKGKYTINDPKIRVLPKHIFNKF